MVKRMLTALTLAFTAALAPGAAHSQDGIRAVVYEVKGGILEHDIDNLWSGFSREGGADLNAEIVFAPSFELLGGTVRPALGASVSTSGDTSRLYLDARWEHELDSGFYLALGLGAAVHDGEEDLVRSDRKALGSEVLFHIPVEVGYRFDRRNGISLYFEHISNAYLADNNEGMDSLGLRYGHRF